MSKENSSSDNIKATKNSNCDSENNDNKSGTCSIDDNDSMCSLEVKDAEDVPSDFFDAFATQDFMAGLDIVDTWDDDDEEEEANNDNEKSKNLDSSKKEGNVSNNKKRHSPIRHVSTNNQRSRRSKDKTRDRKYKRTRSKERRAKEYENEDQKPDHRRDPEKTKRDIQKDKDKCAKDKEARLISEKLKFVETGLIPPGYEMEIDIKQFRSAAKEQDKKTDVKKAEIKKKEERNNERRMPREEKKRHLGEDKKNHSAREERHSSYEKRRKSGSPCPKRRRSGSPNNELYRSHYRSFQTSRGHEFSYERRYDRISRSPVMTRRRTRSRSPYRRERSSERRRSNRYNRDTSPLIIRRTSKPRGRSRNRSLSNVSEREMWLRKRDMQSSRSPSLHGGDKRESFMEELAHILNTEKKIKYYKEVQNRINEPLKCQSPHHYPMVSAPPLPVPAPVPAPILNNPMLCPQPQPIPPSGYNMLPGQPNFPFQPMAEQQPPPIQYDQQFFIGQQVDMFTNNNPYGPYIDSTHPVSMLEPVSPISPSTGSMMDSTLAQSPLQINLLKNHQNNVVLHKNENIAEKQKQQQAVTKLYENKTISLTDFLTVTAKPSDTSNSNNIEKKVKVLSLCQDAIKALGGDSKLSGRFFLRKTFKEPEKKEETKYQSPIRRIPIVRFRFTTVFKGGEEKSSLEGNLDKLLASLGLIKPPMLIRTEAVTSAASEMPAKSTSPSQPESALAKLPPRKLDSLLGSKFQTKMCQTDAITCQVCEVRKACKFTNQSVQCDIKTFDVGTQVTAEDKVHLGIKESSIKDAFKNQSLAHLTAAQILAAQNTEETSPRKELFPSARRLSPPPPPTIAPEKHERFAGRSPKTSIFNMMFGKPHEYNRSVDNRPVREDINYRAYTDRYSDGGRPPQFENMRSNFDNRNDISARYEGPNHRMVEPEVQFEPPPFNDMNERGFSLNNRFGPFTGRRY